MRYAQWVLFPARKLLGLPLIEYINQVYFQLLLFIIKMYPEIINQPYFLPKRSSRKVGGFNNSESLQFVTNLYNVKLDPTLDKIYVYEARFPLQLPQDSSQIVNRCICQVRSQLRNSIGFICFSGKVIYGSKQNRLKLSYQTKVEGSILQIQLRLIKAIDVKQLIKNPQTRPMIFHFLNSKLKLCLRHANICELGKQGSFFQKDQLLKTSKKQMQQEYNNLERAGLNVLRGYKFTLCMINSQLKLQLDVCSRVLQQRNLLEQFIDFCGTKDQLVRFYTGTTIITRYGNYRNYKVQEIDFTKNPKTTFLFREVQISFADYFRKNYNAEITDQKQPLLKVLSQVKRQITKNQTIQDTKQYVYLIPQLVSLSGMKDSQRQNFETMKVLAPFTKLSPNDRYNQAYKILHTFNLAKDIMQIGSQQTMNGYYLRQPCIKFKQVANLKFGTISNRGELLQPHAFSCWFIVYSKFNERDLHDVDNIERSLKQAGKAYGVTFKQSPIYIELKPKNDYINFCEEIRYSIQDFQKKYKTKIELIVVILKPRQVSSYGGIKDMLTNQFSIPCQVIQTKTFTKGKNVLSIASKIVIQMSCKAGDAPWYVRNSLPYFKNRNFAYAALSSSKGKGGFTVSFVGTTNNQLTEVFSSYIIKVQKRDRIDGTHLLNWFCNWLKAYYMNNKKTLPDTLLFYRESVGDSLIKHVLEHQMYFLKQAINRVKTNAKKQDYRPEILFIMVNKSVNTRFFLPQKMDAFNPDPGSVIVSQLSTDDAFDFHLVSQKVTQGTSTPTQYIVAYDSSKISQEELIQFTYEQCYNYYNWQGSVKVPACLQCANKLSKLAGESIQKPLLKQQISKVDKGINESFYFL